MEWARERKKQKKLPWIIAVAVLLIVGIVLYLRLIIAPVVKSVSEEKIKALTVSAVNDAVLSVLNDFPEYTDIVTVHYDKEENINALKVDSAMVNNIVQNTTLKAQENLTNFGMKGIEIPVGSLSGFMSLSGKGPSVTVKVVPVGSITAKLCSEFEEAGINQTNHRIFLKLDANVSVVLPGANNIVKTLTEVLILESVIVGKIPETYLNSTSTQDMMDLIP